MVEERKPTSRLIDRAPASDWIDGFPFLGNHPALDFLNTRPVQNGEAVELLSDFGALLRWFRAAGMLDGRDAARLRRKWARSIQARRALRRIHRLRERLRQDLIAWEAGGALRPRTMQELNRLMALYPMRACLKAGLDGATVEPWFEARRPEHLFAPLAMNAARFFAEVDHRRVHQCDACVLHFYDTSKKGRRRWCSMRLCGNRRKVAAYANRKRERRLAASGRVSDSASTTRAEY